MRGGIHTPGIFFAILGRGPRAFQIGKISAINHYFVVVFLLLFLLLYVPCQQLWSLRDGQFT